MRLTTSLGALLLISVVFYFTNVLLSSAQRGSTSLPKNTVDEPVNLANLPEKMMAMGKYLQSLQGRLDKSSKATPEMGLIMRRTILKEIAEKQAEVEVIERFIRQLFESNSITAEDVKVDLELHLYNCDTFRALTNDVVLQIQEIANSNKKTN